MSKEEGQWEGQWEGLGGPVQVDRPNLDGIDPTLDSCCRREEESIRRGSVILRTLQRHDVVAEKERRRRNLVTATSFQGCRCCYDPNSDGGEYRALIELRAHRKSELDDAEVCSEIENHSAGVTNECDDDDDSDDDEYDYLLDEDLPGTNEELRAPEEMRRNELEMAMFQREVALQHGYGVLRQVHPSRILKAAGLGPGTSYPPPAVVLHLVDPHSSVSASLDLYLEKLAENAASGTRLIRSGGRATLLMNSELASRVLPRLNPEQDMPALIAVRNGVAVNVCPALQGLVDDNDRIDENAVHEWLDRSGVLLESVPRLETVCSIRPEEEALIDSLMTTNPRQEEKRFECGVADCNKTFPHEHVGIRTTHQKGLVVSESEIKGEAAS